MRNFNIIDKDYIESAEVTSKNSLKFENICEVDPFEDSDLGISLWSMDLLDTYLPTIIESCNLMIPDKSAKSKYQRNPWRLSMDNYDTPDMWFLILAVNDFDSPMKFVITGNLLLPDFDVVSNIVTEIEASRKK